MSTRVVEDAERSVQLHLVMNRGGCIRLALEREAETRLTEVDREEQLVTATMEWQAFTSNSMEIAMINLGHVSETKSRQPLPGQDAIGKQLP
jgi:hypothetical protein